MSALDGSAPTPRLYVALVHHPVVNRREEVIASAVTNLDLHDIARAARTYGVRAFFVVTPVANQQRLAEGIVAHWTTGPGADFLPDRREALELVTVTDSVAAAAEAVCRIEGERPLVVATCSRAQTGAVGFAGLRARLAEGRAWVLLFGTAWGLAPAAIAAADAVLSPIEGVTGYNHLSVRSAAAIVLDRLLGPEASNT
jgi:hypothetical protein